MATQRIDITSPVGRIVAGNLYVGRDKDYDGNPLVVKTGPNAGQARVQFFFSIAIAKGSEQHWAHTEWGGKIWQAGNAAFPQMAQHPSFAWKIEDGDSTIPNKKGRKNCETEGHPGHWIIKFSGGMAPKIYAEEGGRLVQKLEENFVKPGYFVQVAFNVSGNGNQNNSGVYLNHDMVCFRAFGPEISFGRDVNEAGFGSAPLPAGAMLTPPPSAAPMPGSVPQAPPPAVPVMPNTQFLQVPASPTPAGIPSVPAAPASSIPAVAMPSPSNLPPAPPAPAGPRMTAAAQGISREAYITAGWNDAQLIANGLMVA